MWVGIRGRCRLLGNAWRLLRRWPTWHHRDGVMGLGEGFVSLRRWAGEMTIFKTGSMGKGNVDDGVCVKEERGDEATAGGIFGLKCRGGQVS